MKTSIKKKRIYLITSIPLIAGFIIYFSCRPRTLAYYLFIPFKNKVQIYYEDFSNNLIGQFFEIGQSSFKKLDVIDFGEFVTEDEDFPEKHVFFVGKVYPDSKGSYTFVNMFTLVFE